MYSPVTWPFGPIVCSATSRLKVCWLRASRVSVSDLRKAAIIALELSGIGGGSESIEILIIAASRGFANATEVSWAITEGAQRSERANELSSVIEREVGFDIVSFFELEKTFAC